eukprot:RCo023129
MAPQTTVMASRRGGKRAEPLAGVKACPSEDNRTSLVTEEYPTCPETTHIRPRKDTLQCPSRWPNPASAVRRFHCSPSTVNQTSARGPLASRPPSTSRRSSRTTEVCWYRGGKAAPGVEVHLSAAEEVYQVWLEGPAPVRPPVVHRRFRKTVVEWLRRAATPDVKLTRVKFRGAHSQHSASVHGLAAQINDGFATRCPLRHCTVPAAHRGTQHSSELHACEEHTVLAFRKKVAGHETLPWPHHGFALQLPLRAHVAFEVHTREPPPEKPAGQSKVQVWPKVVPVRQKAALAFGGTLGIAQSTAEQAPDCAHTALLGQLKTPPPV